MKTDKSTNMIMLFLVFVLAIIIFLGSTYLYQEPIRKFESTENMMDTFVTITVYTGDESKANNVINLAFDEMKRIENIASTWNSSAEAYLLNEDKELNNPSSELFEIITLSKYFFDLTDGYFDITVQPLLDLWSYDPSADKQMWELNNSEQIEKINAVMPFIGSDYIQMIDSPKYIGFEKENMSITLGGIAKGYIVDAGINVLKNNYISYGLINAGGDISTVGGKPDGSWAIAMENPENTQDFITRFKVEDKAVATSGNYIRYFNESANVGHILDPKTGFSADRCWSVSIIADNCTYADTLATGVFVMGPEEGLELINSIDNTECLIIDSYGEIFRSDGIEVYEY